jgi:hypothetical protein
MVNRPDVFSNPPAAPVALTPRRGVTRMMKMNIKKALVLALLAFSLLFPRGDAFSSQLGPQKALEAISYRDFIEVEKKDSYYKGRWGYFSIVVDLIKTINPAGALELGPYRLPLLKGEDTMDIVRVLDNLTYFHDATKTPWPISNKKYDLFICCEVWEHLGDKQKDAFREVLRIARRAIFSFPYKWTYPEGSKDIEALSHANIDEAKISEWTLGRKPKTVVFSKDGKFVVYYFDFAGADPPRPQ